MAQDKKHIDQFFKGKLHDTEVVPPASAWESIASSLDAKQRKAAILLYRWIGSAAAILLLGILSFYFIRSEKTLEPIPNKIAQETIRDSIITNDSLTDFKAEIKIREEKQNVGAKTDLALLDNKNKKAIHQNPVEEHKAVFVAQNEVLESFSKSRERVTIHVLNKLSQGELSSIYTSGFNALSFLKANMYKRMLEAEDASMLLGDNSSSSDNEREPHAWSLGLAFAPTSVGRSTGDFSRNAYDAIGAEMNTISSSERDLAAYSGGFNLEYKLSERWSFQSGVYYLKQGQRIENFGVLQNDLNSSNTSNSYFGNITFDEYTLLTDNLQESNFVQLSDAISYLSYNDNLIQRFALVEIPLLANYKIINRKAVFSITGGISPGIIVGNNVYLENYSSKPIGKTEEINTLIYKSIFGIRIEYPLSRKLYFNFSPTFKLQLNNFNRSAIVSEKLNYLELKTGLNYRF